MSDIKSILSLKLHSYLTELSISLLPEEIIGYFSNPEKPEFGDISIPCFKFSRYLKKKPEDVAITFKEILSEITGIEKLETVGGYLNVFISKSNMFLSLYNKLKEHPETFSQTDSLSGQKIIVEYSSPNIAKPFSIGHLRTTVIGNFLKNLFTSAGADVISINHIGDWGTQFGKLIVAFRMWGNEEELENHPVSHLLDLYVKFHSECEKNTELEEKGREAFKKLEEGAEEETNLWKMFRDFSLKEFNKTYKRLNVSFDHIMGEAFYSDKMGDIIEILSENKLLTESDNATIVNLDNHDMPPCLIRKSDGATLYATRDLAAAYFRKQFFNFDKCFYVVGAEQSLHFKQLFKVLELAGLEFYKDMIHISFGLYRFKEGKMSTRKGQVIFLKDVLNEAFSRIKSEMESKEHLFTPEEIDTISETLSTSAIIFNDLKNDITKNVSFSWDEVLNMEGDSGPYVSYSYVRCNSILKNAEHIPDFSSDTATITHDNESRLIQKLNTYIEVINTCIKHKKSHYLTNYLLELTKSFHSFYHTCKVISDDTPTSSFRKALVQLTAATLKSGCDILGMRLPDKM